MTELTLANAQAVVSGALSFAREKSLGADDRCRSGRKGRFEGVCCRGRQAFAPGRDASSRRFADTCAGRRFWFRTSRNASSVPRA
jgi:hypothetical protein